MKSSHILSVLFGTLVCLFASSANAQQFRAKQYEGFTVWLDCINHGAIAFRYELTADDGSESRPEDNYVVDTSVPAECQPANGNSYRTSSVPVGQVGTYDRGHLVPVNHMDDSLQSMRDTYYVTNILPQASAFNQDEGAWFHTEVISECYRDITDLSIWGGVIFGDDATDDYFLDTHRVVTPDFWWKLIMRADTNTYVAWLFPNSQSVDVGSIDQYVVDISYLQPRLEFTPDFGDIAEATAATESWPVSRSNFRGMTLRCEGQTTSLS